MASGLINTSRQNGGALGIAAVSAIAATSTSHYVHDHAGAGASSGVALDHGLQTGLYTLAGLPLIGVLIVFALIRPSRPARADAVPVEDEVALEEAGTSKRLVEMEPLTVAQFVPSPRVGPFVRICNRQPM